MPHHGAALLVRQNKARARSHRSVHSLCVVSPLPRHRHKRRQPQLVPILDRLHGAVCCEQLPVSADVTLVVPVQLAGQDLPHGILIRCIGKAGNVEITWMLWLCKIVPNINVSPQATEGQGNPATTCCD